MKKLFLVILLIPLLGYSQIREYMNTTMQENLDSLRYYINDFENQYRVKFNSQKLVLDEELNKLAQEHAKWMFETGKFEHSKVAKEKNLAENILLGTDKMFTLKQFANAILQGWKDSPGHNRNLIWYSYAHVGYGFYNGYAVMMFDDATINTVYTGI